MAVFGSLLIFPLLMSLAASSDLLTMTISNWISVALLLGFVALAVLAGLPLREIAFNLSCGLAILCVTFSLFCLGWIGGGDAKLAAATAVWLGWSHILDYGLAASLFGGLLTIGLVAARGFPLPPWVESSWVRRLHDSKSGVPYGIALAAAGLLVYPSSQLWLTVSGA